MIKKVLMTESEVMDIIGCIIKSDIDHTGYQMSLILKLLKVTNWLDKL